jgi:hypothetical protein
MQQKRDELVKQARPPEAVLAGADPEMVKLGAGLNKAYTAALRMGKKGQYTNVLERAKVTAEDYLAHFPPEQRGTILLGALASVYGKEDGGMDTAVWLAGESGTAEKLSVAHQTVEALRKLGILDELIMTREGLVVYPTLMDQETVALENRVSLGKG